MSGKISQHRALDLPAHKVIELDPRDPQFYPNPYRFYADLYTKSPFFWKNYGFWCVCGFDAVNEILRDRRFGRQILHKYSREEVWLALPQPHLAEFHEVEAHSLLNLEPPLHTRLRRLVNSAFISRNVERMQADIEQAANNLLDSIETTFNRPGNAQDFDLLQHYATPFPASIIADLIGVPQQHIPRLLAWSHSMVKVYTMTQTHEEEVAANRAAMEFRTLIVELIAERRRQPEQDLMSLLVQVGHEPHNHTPPGAGDHASDQSGKQLSDDEIVSTVVLLLNAGHEATVHQIGNAVNTILNSSFTAAELFSSPEQSRKTVQELMRIDTPLHLFTRYALEDVTLPLDMQKKPFGPIDESDGVKLQAGTQIGLLLGAANHDPQRFESPSTFNPFRSDVNHVSLGAGIHYCVGASLAQLELLIALRTLFERFPNCQMSATPSYRDSYHFRGLEQLQIRLQ